ncbi:hypothetical protein HZC32_01450 [Candidatus Woesearchaeota archaeon]|nr:hypothetical protein [Candidatus Woesearchaeota archaeon]
MTIEEELIEKGIKPEWFESFYKKLKERQRIPLREEVTVPSDCKILANVVGGKPISEYLGEIMIPLDQYNLILNYLTLVEAIASMDKEKGKKV